MTLDDAPCLDPLEGVAWSSLTLDDVICRDGKFKGKDGKENDHNRNKNPYKIMINKNSYFLGSF